MATSDGGEVSVQIATPAEGGELQRETGRQGAPAKLERRLNRFVRFVAFGEWAGNAFGALAFLWATGVLLGGFCTSLKPTDFWFATVMIFMEAFRIFSRNYSVDNRSLFGTTKALRWISSSFSRILWRPQEGDEVVLFMGLWINLFRQLPLVGELRGVPKVSFLVLMSRRPRWPQRNRWFRTWILVIAYFLVSAYRFSALLDLARLDLALIDLLGNIVAVVFVLLLKLRPRRVVNLTISSFGRKLLSFTKLILVVCLACDLVWNIRLMSIPSIQAINYFAPLLTEVVLLLGSLQAPLNRDMFGRWLDAILRICFLLSLIFPFGSTFSDLFLILIPKTSLSTPVIASLPYFTLLVLLLIGNLQIPAAVTQVWLSSVRFHTLLIDHHDYYPLPKESSKNMVPAIKVFYVLALCQGSLYIMASILGIFSFFPRRSLVHQLGVGGRQGAKAIDLYYHCGYATCMDTGLLAARKTMSLARFAMESLCSNSSSEMQQAGLILLHNLLSQETDSSEELKSRIISSNETLSMLIGMLGWSAVRDRDTRLFAARVIAKLAGSIRIVKIPGTVKLVSCLLDDVNTNQPASLQASLLSCEQLNTDSATFACPIYGESVMANQTHGEEPSAQATSGTGGCSWVLWWMQERWSRMKERWSIPEEPFLAYQDSLPVLGMEILEKLACDLDNCAEMLQASDFIPMIIGLISYTAKEQSNIYDQQNEVVCSSLRLVGRLASTVGKIGATIRQKLWQSPFFLDNLAGIFDSPSSPEVWTLAMDIIAKLALFEDGREELGSNQVFIGKLVRAFLGRDTPNDQSLRMAAGEALVNLSLKSAANCSAILDLDVGPGYELVKNLKGMLCEPENIIYKFVAASLLQNLCAFSRVKLMSHPGASECLKSALPAVITNIGSAKGKQLETLIGLASQICTIPECIVLELEPQTNEAGVLVKKLVDTLNSNKKPSPEFPRMRRVIVQMVISLMKLYPGPGYPTMLRDEGMIDALSKAEMTTSKVEKYMVFSGDEGVVAESGEPLRNLVHRAKGLIIGTTTPTPALN